MSTYEQQPDFGKAALHGARTIGLARLVAESTLLLSSVALARLLTPVDFGHAAVALTVVALAAIVGPAGMTAGVVQRQTLEERHAAASSFLACSAGLGLTIATVVFADTLGDQLFGDETARLLAYAAPAWLIVGLGAVPQSLLLRELRFGRIAIIEVVASLSGAATAVTLAATGSGPVALILGALLTLAVVATASAAATGFVAPGGRSGAIREVGRFAAPVTFSSVVYSLFRNIDYVILSARLPAKDVGLFWRAYQLGVDYQSKISQVMLRVSFPIYARTPTLEDLRARRARIVRVHAAVIVPLLGAFIALAPLVVPWLFGDAWEAAVVPAQIMAVAGMADAVTTGTGPLMIAVGRPGALVRWSLCEFVAYAVLIYALSGHGLTAVSIGVAVFGVATVVANQAFLLRPYVGIPIGEIWSEVLPGLAGATAVLCTVVPLRMLLERRLPTLVAIVVLSAAAAAAASIALRLFPATWTDLRAIASGVGGKRRRGQAAEDAVA
jgi:O-antigen/teichoic acid export membrane protein